MKWIKLTDKEPKFGEEYLLIDIENKWWIGKLLEINQTSTGKSFVFSGEVNSTFADVTHYIKIELPK